MSTANTFSVRAYQNDNDYWRIRAFLREIYLLNERKRVAWQTSSLDYWRWHIYENGNVVDSLEEAIYLCETTDTRQIVAVLINQSRNEAVLIMHPHYQTDALEHALIDRAEHEFGNGGEKFYIYAFEGDTVRSRVLEERGYQQGGDNPGAEYQWLRDLTQPIPEISINKGYTVRAIGDVNVDTHDWQTRSWTSWRAFHPDEPDEDYDGWEWSLNWRRAPLYRRDLDLVAVTPDADGVDQVVAYTVIWFDDVTRSGLFEPVAVMPEHQKRGLGRALMTEGLHRLKRMGATQTVVSGYSVGANTLYRSLAHEHHVNMPWFKMM